MSNVSYADMPSEQKLRALWDAFCDGDNVEPDFIELMDEEGFIELRDVTDDDLDQSFASERGIEPGGQIWELTSKGRAHFERIVSA